MIGSLVNPGTKGASAALIASVCQQSLPVWTSTTKRRCPLKKLPRFLKNVMEREIATKLYVGVIKLYNTFHKLTIETDS